MSESINEQLGKRPPTSLWPDDGGKIANATLDRIERDIHRITHKLRRTEPRPVLSRFAYDHGHTIIYTKDGKRDLLIDAHRDGADHELLGDVARLLQHVSPTMLTELVRGYRAARKAKVLHED